jgi:hypothetical protein
MEETSVTQAASGQVNNEQDHSFYLVVAEELFKMRLRIKNMPKATKGLAALKNNLKRIEDGLILKGYRIVDLTGRAYDDGMIVKVLDFVPLDDMPKGQKKILRTVKPQVTYRHGIISYGEVEVAISAEDMVKNKRK